MIRNGLGLVVLGLCLWTGVSFAQKNSKSTAPRSKEWSILWVIDNSLSFTARREIIKKYLPTFSQKLQAAGVTSFRMGVTTTDYFTQQGYLIEASATKVVSGETEKGRDIFKTMLDKIEDTPTSFWEQGLESAYQAIVKDGNFLIREGVPLAVIYVTDENDYSCEKNCSGVEPEHNKDWKAFSVERYAAQFKSMGNNNTEVYPFPMVGLNGGNCEVASYGERYLGLMNMMGRGHSYSVCENEFEKGLNAIAEEMGGGSVPVGYPKWTKNPIELAGFPYGVVFHGELQTYVEGGGASLKFEKISGPAWLSVNPDGTLFGAPTISDVGDNVFRVRAIGPSGLFSNAELRIVVIHNSQPPHWKKDPISLGDITAEKAFSFDLSRFVVDPEGDVLGFQAELLPPWLTLDANGILRGTPSKSDAGNFAVSVWAADSVNTVRSQIVGTVVAR